MRTPDSEVFNLGGRKAISRALLLDEYMHMYTSKTV